MCAGGGVDTPAPWNGSPWVKGTGLFYSPFRLWLLTYGGGDLPGKEAPVSQGQFSTPKDSWGGCEALDPSLSEAGGWVQQPGGATWAGGAGAGSNGICSDVCHAGCLMEDGVGSRRELWGGGLPGGEGHSGAS